MRKFSPDLSTKRRRLLALSAVLLVGSLGFMPVQAFGAADTTRPTTPTNVKLDSKTPTSINLTWSASQDNVGVSGYRVYRNNTYVGASSGLSFVDKGLSAATTYTYGILAYDAAGNTSYRSGNRSAMTRHPDATSTGVPAGTSLTASGSITVTQAGAVIDAKQVTGSISIKANNVTIRRTRILATGAYPIRVESGFTGALVEDTTIDGRGVATAATMGNSLTIRRANIYGVLDGPRIGSDFIMVESYIHHLHRITGGHHDALQTTGASNVILRRNNLQAYNSTTGDVMNTAIQIGEEFAVVRNMVVEDNLMNGGNFTVNAGGGGTTGAQVQFRRNKFGRNFRYGPAGNIGPGIVWESTNVYLDNGQPVR